MWTVLAMGLLGKIILNARIWQYGFALAMPAAILLVAVLVGVIPKQLRRGHGRAQWFRRFAVLFILLDVVFSWQFSHSNYSRKNLVIGDHGDAIITYGTQVSPLGLRSCNCSALFNPPSSRRHVGGASGRSYD